MGLSAFPGCPPYSAQMITEVAGSENHEQLFGPLGSAFGGRIAPDCRIWANSTSPCHYVTFLSAPLHNQVRASINIIAPGGIATRRMGCWGDSDGSSAIQIRLSPYSGLLTYSLTNEYNRAGNLYNSLEKLVCPAFHRSMAPHLPTC